jgi:dienelactone hydrolase
MRPLEWLLVAAVAARLLGMVARGRWATTWRRLTAFVAGAALVAHVVLEGPRWTLAPTYLLAGIMLLLLARERPHPELLVGRVGTDRGPRRPTWGRALLWTASWLPTVALAWLLPVWSLPPPTGAWAVGSLSFTLDLPDAVLVDGRVETGRRTMVRLWYPVDPKPSLRADAPWTERADVVLPAMAASGGLPPFVLDHLTLVRTHAAWEAPLAATPATTDARAIDALPRGWPVVTFDHGLGGFRSQNTFLAEELASHGAVVAALDHPGDALGTTLADGTTIPYSGLPPSSDPGYAEAVIALGERWTADTLTLLRTLADLPPIGELAPFAGNLDLDRVLATGHSTGGGVAFDVCHAWEGCRAVLALDPWWAPVAPDRLGTGSDRPFVVVASDPEVGYFAPANAERFARFAAASEGAWSALVLVGGGHHDVNDTSRLSPIAGRLGHSVGPVDPDAGAAAVRAVAVAMLGGAGPLDVAATVAMPIRVDGVAAGSAPSTSAP